ncbi:MAG: hypothetical protein WDN45_11920 [Caulobacteraceae bacterium]
MPASLVAIGVLTVLTTVFKLDVGHIADLGQLPTTLPGFALPQVPATWETLAIVAPVALRPGGRGACWSRCSPPRSWTI